MAAVCRLESTLLAAVADRVAKFGFAASADQRFVRATPCGNERLRLELLERFGVLRVSASFGVRYDDVERIVRATSGRPSTPSEPGMPTLGGNLREPWDGPVLEWLVKRPGDVSPVADAIANSFERTALPHFERLRDQRYALAMLCRNDREASLMTHPIESERACAAVALASLLKSEDTARTIAQEKLRALTQLGQRLQTFLDFLGRAFPNWGIA